MGNEGRSVNLFELRYSSKVSKLLKILNDYANSSILEISFYSNANLNLFNNKLTPIFYFWNPGNLRILFFFRYNSNISNFSMFYRD